MKKAILPAITIVFTLFSIAVVNAQDDIQVKKYDNPKWTRIEMIKFKDGKASGAGEIIN
jgi:hypothetical protein